MNNTDSTPSARPQLAHEDISRRAEEIWREYGCPQGRDEEIWLEAENQLIQKVNTTSAPAAEDVRAESASDAPRSSGIPMNSNASEPRTAPSLPAPTAPKADDSKKKRPAPPARSRAGR